MTYLEQAAASMPQRSKDVYNTLGNFMLMCIPMCCRYFWYNNALDASDSIGVAGNFNWKLFLCLLLAWVVVYLCLFRGIKSSGKVCRVIVWVYVLSSTAHMYIGHLFHGYFSIFGSGVFVFPSGHFGRGWFRSEVFIFSS